MQFVGLRDAVVVFVDPKQKVREYRVTRVDDPVAVAAVLRPVKFRQRQITVGVIGRRLCRGFLWGRTNLLILLRKTDTRFPPRGPI